MSMDTSGRKKYNFYLQTTTMDALRFIANQRSLTVSDLVREALLGFAREELVNEKNTPEITDLVRNAGGGDRQPSAGAADGEREDRVVGAVRPTVDRPGPASTAAFEVADFDPEHDSDNPFGA